MDRSSSDMDTAMEEDAKAGGVPSSRDSGSDAAAGPPNLQVAALRNILGTEAEQQVRRNLASLVLRCPSLR